MTAAVKKNVKRKKKHRLNLAKVNKLSTLLRIGLAGLTKQEKLKNAKVEMGHWLYKTNLGICQACLAGCVMKFSLGMIPKKGEHICPDSFNIVIESRLNALDSLRTGYIHQAAEYIRTTTKLEDRYVVNYHTNSRLWWADMENILVHLEEAGE